MGDINGIFGKAQQTSFNPQKEGAAGKAIINATEGVVNTSGSLGTHPSLAKPVQRQHTESVHDYSQAPSPVVRKRLVVQDPSKLPSIDSANSFEEQIALVVLHLKAYANDSHEIRTIINSWMDVILDEDAHLRPEVHDAMLDLTKSELITIMSAILSFIY